MPHSEMINANKIFFEKSEESIETIIKKIYLASPTINFIGNSELTYNILNEVSDFFNIPFKHIYITGSAQLGFSLKTLTKFQKGSSDLDLAIVDSNLYSKILNQIVIETESLRMKSGFKRRNDSYTNYIENVSRGFIHPLYFPSGETKNEWDKFFSKLTIKNKKEYSKISACLFISEESFKIRQMYSFNFFRKQRALGVKEKNE